jgi:hypothetical protein
MPATLAAAKAAPAAIVTPKTFIVRREIISSKPPYADARMNGAPRVLSVAFPLSLDRIRDAAGGIVRPYYDAAA